jgi:DNA-binding transcriptional MocR family regulator
VAARPEWIDALVDLKIATSFGGGCLAEALILKTLTDGGYRKHMETVRQRLSQEMEKVAGRLQKMGSGPP